MDMCNGIVCGIVLRANSLPSTVTQPIAGFNAALPAVLLEIEEVVIEDRFAVRRSRSLRRCWEVVLQDERHPVGCRRLD
jgi:hypothetical protein